MPATQARVLPLHTMRDSPATDFFLGRQPILDRTQRIVAYELLFRHDRTNRAHVDDDAVATATVLSHVFGELGVAAALGPHQGFVNVDEALLLGDALEFLPKKQIVLELLETVPMTPQVVDRVHELHAAGFTIALDDFASDTALYAPILDCVAIAKVDLLSVDDVALREAVEQLRRWPVRLLAEKVDSREQAEQCMALGFELFQGYYFARPVMIEGRKLLPSEMALLELLGLVLSDAESRAIEDLFKRHPDLSLNLLRLSNSVGVSAQRKITSLRQAITLLGRRQIQRWLQLLLYTCDRAGESFPSPLLELAATRGRLMELLAEAAFPRRHDAGEHAFMVGIMSLMDTLLGMPTAQVLDGLAAPPEVRDALLGRSGTFGPLLDLVESLESGGGDAIGKALAACPALTPETVNAAHSAALRWTSGSSPGNDTGAVDPHAGDAGARTQSGGRSRTSRHGTPETAPGARPVRSVNAR